MAALLIFLLLSLFSALATSQFQSTNDGFISAAISENGLVFVKNYLVEKASRSLTLVRLPDIEKSMKIPLIGGVHVSAFNITLDQINVSSSTIHPSASGFAIVASGITVGFSLEWSYSYNTWVYLPFKVSDEGSASVQAEGLEVSLAISMQNKNGTLALSVTQCDCNMEDIQFSFNGKASWFYKGFAKAFKNHILSAVEIAITKKILDGTRKLNTVLQLLPKQICMGNFAALNTTIVNDPHVGNSSIVFEVNGLFVQSTGAMVKSYQHKQFNSSYSEFCGNTLKMLGISVDQAVFDSASLVLFKEGLFHWIVDKVPDQSLLNTASWKFIIPQLYKKYPNDEMQLNLSLPSAPLLEVTKNGFVATIFLDMTVEVLDGYKAIPVACISVEFTASGTANILENKLIGKARLNDFYLSMKWSNIGNFPLFLIQGAMRVFLNNVAMPYVNIFLHKGYSIPVFHGLTLHNGHIVTTSSKIILCSDIAFIDSSVITDYSA